MTLQDEYNEVVHKNIDLSRENDRLNAEVTLLETEILSKGKWIDETQDERDEARAKVERLTAEGAVMHEALKKIDGWPDEETRDAVAGMLRTASNALERVSGSPKRTCCFIHDDPDCLVCADSSPKQLSRCTKCKKGFDYECLTPSADPECYDAYCAECAPELHDQLEKFLATADSRQEPMTAENQIPSSDEETAAIDAAVSDGRSNLLRVYGSIHSALCQCDECENLRASADQRQERGDG